jgi:predicted TIM-barrel fold metal-dependent hydrolase
MTGSQRLIDCDVHCAPTIQALAPYLPEIWREHLALNSRVLQPVAATYPDWNPSTRTPAAELTLERLRSEVLPEASLAILHCYYAVESFSHPYLGSAVATAVNSWLREQWLERDDRLLGSIAVTPQYPELAVAEIERWADDRRFVQVLLPARSPAGYGNQRYWPILKAAAEHGLAVAIIFGGGTGSPPTPVNWLSSYYEEYNTAPLNYQGHVMSLVMSGIFPELPDLKVVVAEGGWTWLPPFMWRMDQEWKAFQREVPWVKSPPSEYVRRHFRFTTQPFDAPPGPEQIDEVLEQIGSDELLMYGSDHPHRYLHGNVSLLARLSPEQAERVRWQNAAECYGLAGRSLVSR